MRLIYQGVDITDKVDVRQAEHRDCSHGRFDALHLVMYHSAEWSVWKPELDDVIRVTHDGYDTGDLFLNAVKPFEDGFELMATSAKCAARKKAYAAYENKSLTSIMSLCAAEGGMGYKLYGLNGGLVYPYLVRRQEGASAFLDRLCGWEGACLKTYAGKYTAIDLKTVQSAEASGTLVLDHEDGCVSYERHDEKRIASLTVETPACSVTARDTSVKTGVIRVMNNLPALDAAAAGRWARGLLLMMNREAEELNISSDFNAGMTALARFDVKGGTEADGQWIVDEVQHDFVNDRTRARLLRCVTTVV